MEDIWRKERIFPTRKYLWAIWSLQTFQRRIALEKVAVSFGSRVFPHNIWKYVEAIEAFVLRYLFAHHTDVVVNTPTKAP